MINDMSTDVHQTEHCNLQPHPQTKTFTSLYLPPSPYSRPLLANTSPTVVTIMSPHPAVGAKIPPSPNSFHA